MRNKTGFEPELCSACALRECGIQRIDGPSRTRGRGQRQHSGPTHGWQARIPITGPGGGLTRFCADAKHGGREAAYAAAVEWRRTELAALGVPHHPQRSIRIRPRSSHGRVGVYRSRRPCKRGERVYESPAWVATFSHHGGRLSASFAVSRYGEAGARARADQARAGWELEYLGAVIPPAAEIELRSSLICGGGRHGE